jgi:putative ABC transport system substrate-binding protein
MPSPSAGHGMRRRDFVGILGGAAGWPILASAQQPKIYRLGYLAPVAIPHLKDALFGALRDLGYVEGQNLKVEYRYGAGEALDALAAELVELKLDVIVTVATPQALAAKRATASTKIPRGDGNRGGSPRSPRRLSASAFHRFYSPAPM